MYKLSSSTVAEGVAVAERLLDVCAYMYFREQLNSLGTVCVCDSFMEKSGDILILMQI